MNCKEYLSDFVLKNITYFWFVAFFTIIGLLTFRDNDTIFYGLIAIQLIIGFVTYVRLYVIKEGNFFN